MLSIRDEIDKAVKADLEKKVAAERGSFSVTANTQSATAEIEGPIGRGWSVGAYVRRVFSGGKTEAAGTIKKSW